MVEVFKKLIFLMDESDKKKLLAVGFIMTVMAGLELVGISLIFPFMTVLASPETIETNKILSFLYSYFDFHNQNSFLVFLGCGVVTGTIFTSAFNIYTNYEIVKFTEVSSCKLSTKLLTHYMHKPYSFFLTRNSAELSKNVLSEVNQVTSGVLLPGLQVVSRSILLFILFGFVLFFDFKTAITVVFILGGFYWVIYYSIRNRTFAAGQERLNANKQKYELISKIFGGIKEIKLLNKAHTFIQDFQGHFNTFVELQIQNQLFSTAPRYIMEMVAIILVIVFIVVSYLQGQNFSTIIPRLGLFALVGYKSLPALQLIYNSITRIKFYSAAVETLFKDLLVENYSSHNSSEKIAVINFKAQLKFKDVNFTYESSHKPLFNKLNLEILSGSIVGFVGSTGSGKTTLVDIIMGLLTPDSGQVLIDQVALNHHTCTGWQSKIGYVPQRIYLSDDTVLKNIAFGLPVSEINIEKVYEVARIARIHDFIVNELPKGYETSVGDRGVRLSGGQCQRIGIARALYNSPEVLVLDEATSALDNVTESEVLEQIRALNYNCTIIMIAHRLSTVRNCSKIFLLEKGEIISQGTFDSLLEKSEKFRELTGTNVST